MNSGIAKHVGISLSFDRTLKLAPNSFLSYDNSFRLIKLDKTKNEYFKIFDIVFFPMFEMNVFSIPLELHISEGSAISSKINVVEFKLHFDNSPSKSLKITFDFSKVNDALKERLKNTGKTTIVEIPELKNVIKIEKH